MKQIKKLDIPEPSNTSKWLARAGFSTLFVMALMVGIIFYQIFLPPKILEITKQPVPVSSEPIYAGQEVTLVLSYCKYEKITPIKVDVYLEGEYYLPAISSIGSLPIGCYTDKPIRILVPITVPTGDYHLKVIHTYRPSFLQEVIVPYDSVDFKVLTNPILQQAEEVL